MSNGQTERAKCEATSTRTGQRCTAWAVRGESQCAGHLGRGIGADPERYSRLGAAVSAEVRQARVERRKTNFQSALEAEAVEHAEALARRLREIALDTDSTKSEAIAAMKFLVERAHGKPNQQVTQHTEYSHPDLIPTEELMRLLAEEEGT